MWAWKEYVAEGWWIDDQGKWYHGPWWKKAINRTLRFFQKRGPGPKFVLYTKAKHRKEDDYPTVVGYGFGKIEHLE